MSLDERQIRAYLDALPGGPIRVSDRRDELARIFELPPGGLALPDPLGLVRAAAGPLASILPETLAKGAVQLESLRLNGLGRAAFRSMGGRDPELVLDVDFSTQLDTGDHRHFRDASGKGSLAIIHGDRLVRPSLPFPAALVLRSLEDWVALHVHWGNILQPAGPGLFQLRELTVMFWVRPEADGLLMSNAHPEGAPTSGWTLERTQSKLALRWYAAASTHILRGSTDLPANEWSQVVMAWDGFAVRAYVNAEDQGPSDVRVGGDALHTHVSDRAIELGVSRRADLPPPLRGELAQLRFYDRALSPTEVERLANPHARAAVEPTLEAALVWRGARWALLSDLVEVAEPALALTVGAGWVAAELSAEVDLAGTPFQLDALFPGGRSTLAQREGTDLKLTALLDKLHLDSGDWTGPSLRGVRTMVDPESRRMVVHASVNEVVSLGPVKLEQVAFDLIYQGQAPKSSSGNLSATLTLALQTPVVIDLRGEHAGPGQGWSLGGAVGFPEGLDLPLGRLATHLGELFGVSLRIADGLLDLRIQAIAISGSTKGKWSFAVQTEQSRGSFEALRATDGTWSLAFSERLRIGDAAFEVSLSQASGVKRLDASWKQADGGSVSLGDLLAHVGLELPVPLPAAIDLRLKSANLRISERDQASAVSCDATLAGGQSAFIVAVKQGGSWKGATGVALDASGLSQVPGAQELLTAVDLSPRDVVLMVSTLEAQGFVMPPLPTLGVAFPGLGTTPLDLRPGLLVATRVDLGASKNPMVASLRALTGQGDLVALLSLAEPLANSRVAFALNGKLVLPGKLTLSDTAASLAPEPPAASLRGTAMVPIGHDVCLASGRLAVGATESLGAFDVKSSKGLPCPLGLKGVQLDDLGMEVGVVYAPPGVMMGLQGQFHIGDQAHGVNRFALVFEIEEASGVPLPDPLLLSVYLATLSVETAIVALKGESDPRVPEFIRKFSAYNVWLYWCQEPVMLPDGSSTQPGFGFNALLDLHGWTVYARLCVDPQAGVNGTLMMAPIRHGKIFSLGAKGTPALSVLQQQVNGNWAPVQDQSLAMPGRVDGKKSAVGPPKGALTELREIIPAGGAMVTISSRHSPYLRAEVDLTFFGVDFHLHAEIDDRGLELELDVDVGPAHARWVLQVGRGGLSASARFVLAVDHRFDLYIFGRSVSIHLDTELELDIALSAKGEEFRMAVHAEFDYGSLHLAMPALVIHVPLPNLNDLPKSILGHIESCASEIFSEVFGPIGRLVGKVGDEIKHIGAGAEHAVARIGADAVKAGEKAWSDVSEAAKVAGDALRKLGERAREEITALEQLGAAALSKVGADLRRDLEHFGRAIADVANRVREQISKLLGEAEAVFAHIGQQIAAVAQEALHKIKELLNAVKEQIAHLTRVVSEEVKAILDDAKKEVEHIEHALANFANSAGKAVKELFDDAGGAVKHGAGKVEHAVEGFVSDGASAIGGLFS